MARGKWARNFGFTGKEMFTVDTGLQADGTPTGWYVRTDGKIDGIWRVYYPPDYAYFSERPSWVLARFAPGGEWWCAVVNKTEQRVGPFPTKASALAARRMLSA
jgi:hypothetical protein